MLNNLKDKFNESIFTIIPIVMIVMLLSFFVHIPQELLISFIISAILLVLGTSLFTFGADISMLSIGEKIGDKLVRSKRLLIILFVCLVIGTAITIAEPDLRVLADQLTSIPSNTLIIIISVGVGAFMLLSALRSIFGLSLNMILSLSFILIFLLVPLVPEGLIPIAFDAGGATTGTISIPFIMTLGVGLVSSRTDKKAKESSFGLVALCSTGPILAVMLLGIIYNSTVSTDASLLINNDFSYNNYLTQLVISFKDVMFSISPIIIVFIIYQLITKDVGKVEMRKIIFGIIIIIIGLTLFLVAANVGFMDMGYFIGEEMFNSKYRDWLTPVTMIMAFFIAVAEPAVQILIDQVEELTEGNISRRAMNLSLSLGVSLAAGLSIHRLFTGVSFIYYAIPAYVICLVLMLFVPKTFTAVAFDAGGAAGGTLTTTFLLPIAIGACIANKGDILTDAFGISALASVVPIITVQIIGIIYQLKNRNNIAIEDLDESIVDYCWEG
ncbi:MAG: DUF1538 family protein [Bacilli bacterium]|nr:DUF1538 family protein [Bacilli bacterium]